MCVAGSTSRSVPLVVVAAAALLSGFHPRARADVGSWHVDRTRLGTAPVVVQLENKYNRSCAMPFGAMFWLSVRSMMELNMPTEFCGSACGTVSFAGQSYQVAQINPTDGVGACGFCGGCGLGFIGLEAGVLLPNTLRPGDNVSMVFAKGSGPGPPAPPTPPTPPTPAPAMNYTCDGSACVADPGGPHRDSACSHMCSLPPAPPPAGAVSLQMLTKNSQDCDHPFSGMFWIPAAALATLGMPTTFCGSNCGTLSFMGLNFSLGQINPDDGVDQCSDGCAGCKTAFIGLMNDIPQLPQTLKPGDSVLAVYTRAMIPLPTNPLHHNVSCVPSPGFNHLGNDIRGIPNTGNDTASCCAACKAEPACAIWVISDKSCFLKTAYGEAWQTWVEDPFAISMCIDPDPVTGLCRSHKLPPPPPMPPIPHFHCSSGNKCVPGQAHVSYTDPDCFGLCSSHLEPLANSSRLAEKRVNSDDEAVQVQIESKYNTTCGQPLGSMFWLKTTALAKLGIPETFCGSNCGSLTLVSTDSSSTQQVQLVLTQINPSDGTAQCGFCQECKTAFIGLDASSPLPLTIRAGTNVTMSYSKDTPPAPPTPPTPPPAPTPSPPPAPTPSPPPPVVPPSFPFNYSNTHGDSMVLQRDTNALVWGFGTLFAMVSINIVLLGDAPRFNSTVETMVSSEGIWRVRLPSRPAGGPYAIHGTSPSTGESFVVSDVLFGDVIICAGQ